MSSSKMLSMTSHQDCHNRHIERSNGAKKIVGWVVVL